MTDNKIVVKVDPDLKELIPGFLENRRKDVASLRDALARRDCAPIQSTGHSLKGVGGGYGFAELSTIGAEIEIAAKAGNLDALPGLIERMAAYLDRVEVVFE
jgi:HPt (histidine-containing phosphotransfer) domain-containing protein